MTNRYDLGAGYMQQFFIYRTVEKNEPNNQNNASHEIPYAPRFVYSTETERFHGHFYFFV